MRIGILTFHRAINNGAILQAYALKTYMEGLGHDVEMIDYWPDGHEEIYSLVGSFKRTNVFIKDFRLLLLRLLSYSRAKVRKQKMQFLYKTLFNVGDVPKYKTGASLSKINFDCILYGSDQIWWNSEIVTYLGYDSVYWGEFVPQTIKKIAYAPSMRHAGIKDEDKGLITGFLKNFDKLSVRETEVAEIISPLADKKVQVVLDPVFLLKKEQWREKCKPVKSKPYVLYYNLLESRIADRFVADISKKRGLEIVELTGFVHPFKFGRNVNQTADAFEFISLINDAELVVTSSFHGVAFSVIFEKQFYAVGMGGLSGRVTSLLNMLDIRDRMLNDTLLTQNVPEIDYSKVCKRLNENIKKSQQYLIDL